MIGRKFDDAGRLMVDAGNRNPVDIADDAAQHILGDNEPPRLFSACV